MYNEKIDSNLSFLLVFKFLNIFNKYFKYINKVQFYSKLTFKQKLSRFY